MIHWLYQRKTKDKQLNPAKKALLLQEIKAGVEMMSYEKIAISQPASFSISVKDPATLFDPIE